jgi:hypothetical protein
VCVDSHSDWGISSLLVVVICQLWSCKKVPSHIQQHSGNWNGRPIQQRFIPTSCRIITNNRIERPLTDDLYHTLVHIIPPRQIILINFGATVYPLNNVPRQLNNRHSTPVVAIPTHLHSRRYRVCIIHVHANSVPIGFRPTGSFYPEAHEPRPTPAKSPDIVSPRPQR